MLNTSLLLGRMAEKGVTQKRLAKAIGISDNTMTSRLRMRTYFDTEEIDKICSTLEITDNNDKINIFLFNPSQIRDETKSA